ncbi:putative 2-aminoethylphosphonate ABC transporter permease subunit [Aquitalea sp. LB_tupeE]|uniref:putative 2-aminoethylphosphonate ABC transporter permease subunit n=1 Tax=Aquitalea sp. LB_tupeE TaxID=2748078 RepID=UPI0015BE2188|nr:putative 2-aminoethylphosphonate ABC transporter permease subunit [Aquitalea sp. LB_tupeE]NWK76502.1 putative 2-aminoethylphosphonate ABC transporter permease subunit [Aquitalea sp. LB_tupeE]
MPILRRSRRLAASVDETLAGVLQWLLLAVLVVAVLLPLSAILGKALTDGDGQFAGFMQISKTLSQPGLLRAISGSLQVAVLSTLLVVPLAYGYAAALCRVQLPMRGLFRLLALLPLLAPSLLPGISLVYLFGNQGLLKEWLPGGSIYGLTGIVLGEAFYTFPHALMILLTALAVGDARLYEAAGTLGAGRVRQFLTITLPGSRYGVVSAALLVFTLTVTDFGVPKIIGGAFPVLAVEAYKQVIGQQNFAQGAVIGLLLLLPAVLSFMLDQRLQRRQQAQLSAKSQPLQALRGWPARLLALAFCSLIGAGLLLMMGTAIAAAFIRQWPYQMTFTLAHFNFDQVDGGGWLAFGNSLRMALATAVVGSSLAFLGAWSSCKLPAARLGSNLLHAIAMLPMAVPGLVLGLGYIFFFNSNANPLHGLYGSMAMLVLCTVAHYTTTAHMTARTALTQLDPDFEPVAASLKVPLWLTLWRVTLPACLPAILEISRYFFVSAMTTVSAVIFLYTPDTVLAAVAVLNMDDAGDTAAAAAMATLIVASAAVVCLLFALLSHALLRQHQRWHQPAAH